VPQGRHAHGLLTGGGRALEALFPGLFPELSNAGAVTFNLTRDSHWFFEGGEHLGVESDLDAVGLSRPLLEGIVRERVRKIPNIYIREGCQAQELVATTDNRCVIGVRMDREIQVADLVVDATGRGSHSPRWLEAMGYARPPEERIDVNISYASRCFRRSPHHLNGGLFASVAATPRSKKGGVIVAQERDLWIVTLNAYGGAAVPTQLAGFIDFARTLPASHIYDVISGAEPVGEPYAARFPASVRRRYEYMYYFPDGYLVLGDAISSFNPVYGQGMSVAALEALELSKALSEGRIRLAQRFFAQAAKIVDIPWSIAAGNDVRMPHVVGPKTLMTRFFNWYVARLHMGARREPNLVTAFHNVTNLLAPPQSLLRPRLAARVLTAAFSRKAEMPAQTKSIGATA